MCDEYFELLMLSEDFTLRGHYASEAQRKGGKDKTDSGCDLYAREDVLVEPHGTACVRFGVACRKVRGAAPCIGGYWCLPRSSLGKKTPLLMANSVGLIDQDYRGELMAYVRNVSNMPFKINKYESWFQLALPSLHPARYKIVESLDQTPRGARGFGSTEEYVPSACSIEEAKE